MKIDNVETNGKYEIVCELYYGMYKYILKHNKKEKLSVISKKSPKHLSKQDIKIKRMIESIHIINNVNIKGKQNEIFYNMVNNLNINLKDNEIIYSNCHQTNGMIYIKGKETVLFCFEIIDIKKENDCYYLTITNSFENKIISGSLSSIIKTLNDDNLINNSVSNYKFIFNCIINEFITIKS